MPSPPVEEERRLVTALFCDLVGFTPLSESLDPEEVRQIQGMYFTQMSAELYRFGGSVEKYAGDAVLALFGNPVAHEDDPERAVRCALAMQQAFQPVAEMAKREYGRELAVRIGVNTGDVVTGAWDVDGRLDYSATGDALNTAARLQTAADPGGVIVGPETMHLARRAIRFGPRRDLTLKGKSELFPAYPVLGLREEIAERWEDQDRRHPLVGRERDLIFLLDAWERVQTGEGQVVTLIAEAGVGKSRLLAEAVERMIRSAGTVALRGRCLSHGESLSLHLVADLLRSMCQLREGTAPEHVREQVRSTVDALLAPWDQETRDAAADVIGGVLGLPPGGSTVTNASPQMRRQMLVRSLQLLLSALSTYRPAIVVLEDLHWVDQASVEVLEAVLPALRERQAIVLGTHRPGRAMPWEEWQNHHSLPLEPLAGDDALALARTILGHAELDPELERQVTDRAGGNPFFVEELLRNMLETNSLEDRDGRLCLLAGAAERLPSTLTEVLMARLDQLERTARSTAQLGSVIGRSFAVPLLSRVAEQKEEQLQGPLDTLEHADIATPRHNPEREYVFKHATIREVAYNALLLRRRRSLHGATARAIIDLYPVDDQVDLIAYHFSQTRENAEAAVWLERSGDRAASVFANEQAIQRYNEARQRQNLVAAPAAECARIDEKLGRIQRVVGKYDEALETLEAAVRMLQSIDDDEGERRVTAEIGRVHRARGTADAGVDRIKSFLDAQTDTTPTSGLAALNVALARLYFSLGRYQEDFEVASRGSEFARMVGDVRVLAEAEMVRSGALYYLRQIEDALQAMEDAIPLAEAAGDFEVLSILLGNASVLYRDAAKLEKSLQYQERSVHLTERTGDLANHAFALVCMGEITFLLGDWDGARSYLERSQATVRSIGSSWFASYPPLQLGRVEVARGAFDAAYAHLEEALRIARSGEDSQPVILALCFLAEMDLLRNQPTAALERLNEVLDGTDADTDHSTVTVAMFFAAWAYLDCGNLAKAAELSELAVDRLIEENSVVELLIAKRVVGMVAGAQEDYDRAAAIFEEVAELARQVPFPHAEACALYEHGMMCLRRGDLNQARSHLEAGLEIFSRLGAQPFIERSKAALSQIAD
jgi:class 3 adenylate cyclase/tetratricopeptide (TPR) repeat protein